MRCAVVDNQGTVINIIVAEPDQDPAPGGCILYGITADIWVDIGWQWKDRISVPTPTATPNPVDPEII